VRLRLWLGLLHAADLLIEIVAQWRANRALRIKDEQLEAAARAPLTRDDLRKRLRDGSF